MVSQTTCENAYLGPSWEAPRDAAGGGPSPRGALGTESQCSGAGSERVSVALGTLSEQEET